MDTNIIPQFELVFKIDSPTLGGCCQFCNQPAEPDTQPPLCLLHLDWVMLISFMQRRSMEITPDSIKAHLAQAQANGGEWLLTPADVDRLYGQFFGNAFAAEFANERNGFERQVQETVNGK